MKGFLITHKGMEDIAALEVKELIGKNSETDKGCITFDIKEYEDLFKLCYKSQSAIGIYNLLNNFYFDNLFDDFKKNIEKINFKEWLNINIQFRVKCIKKNNENLSTPEIEKKLGELIIDHIQERYNYKQKVSLDNPDITVFVYLTANKCYIGIDFAGFDLSKRSYNIFTHPAAVKGTIAYFLVRLSEYNKNETMLYGFSGSGTIPIEAALFALNFPINFFNKEKFVFLKFEKFKNYNFKKFFEKIDKNIKDHTLDIYNIDWSMKYLNFAKKNSKIAGIGKKINFSRMDIEWLDTKFEKSQVNKIIANIPLFETKENEKLYNEFFYQTEFILNKKGKIVLIGNKDMVKKYSAKHKFIIYEERSVFSGKKEYKILVLSK